MTLVAEAPKQVLTGEGLLTDFRAAVDIAKEIGAMENWVLSGKERESIVRKAQNNPLYADQRIATKGLSTLLNSAQEKERMQELVEESRRLNVGKYLGQEATFAAIKGDVLVKFNAGDNGYDDSPTFSFRQKKTDRITSLFPARQVIRIGEKSGFRSVVALTAFWEVHPFDKETGLSQVDVKLATEL